MKMPAMLLRHTVTVERYEGSSAYGETYAAPVPLDCFREHKRRLVRDAAGNEVVSETTLYAMPDTDPIPAGSRVTVDGTATTVIAADLKDGGGLPTPDHLEVVCE